MLACGCACVHARLQAGKLSTFKGDSAHALMHAHKLIWHSPPVASCLTRRGPASPHLLCADIHNWKAAVAACDICHALVDGRDLFVLTRQHERSAFERL
mmetsp:Transcript_2756/g.5646  ORF Transcript_2756/g.5646 Transcript_2756/m.5646 type:complete len:99 (+) Transcript_2756:381-677(+)